MKAIQMNAPKAEIELVSRNIPAPREGEVLAKVQARGVCHGEAVLKEGQYPGLSCHCDTPSFAASAGFETTGTHPPGQLVT
jgi:D-arabinose 1-dehydrogenase-like Zn-dependent alcohol dehydrogenase